MHQSPIAIIAMLGVLKAGGAFCAMDVSYPDDRLAEMISDTQASIVVASSTQTNRLSTITSVPVVDLSDSLVSKLSIGNGPQSEAANHSTCSPASLMYAIFTSGSTGRPKGVMIEHAAWLTSALTYGADQGISHQSRVLQFASYAFDMSLMEIFTTLILGGCVCVPADEDRYSIGSIQQFVNTSNVNTLMLTPSYAKLLDPVAMPGVRALVTGGEAVPRSLLERWNPHVDTYIAYGPTEASIQAAGVRLPRGTCTEDIPSGLIGRPTGCQVWIVSEDDHSVLVNPGQVGELLIGGRTLARGYLGDEAKTNAAFVHVTFAGHTGNRRVYKTGDLVREDGEGNLVFVGRKDTQIKMQGQRFEISEIESRLASALPAGVKCCVEKVESKSCLVAFVSTSMETASAVSSHTASASAVCWEKVDDTLRLSLAVRDELSRCLPAPMIPSLYIPVTTIPLTSSHKIDRKVLRQLVEDLSADEISVLRRREQKQTEADSDINGTLTANESTLRDLWALVLDINKDTIQPGDSFIQLGGDSVACIRLISAARGRGILLTSAVVLGTPILREQAQKMHTSVASDKDKSNGQYPQPFSLLDPEQTNEIRATAGFLCKVAVEDIEDIFPMSIPQMRWYGKTLTKPDAWIDQYHFQLKAGVDVERFKTALCSVVEAADLLRARVVVTRDRKLFQAVLKHRQPEIVSLHEDSLEPFLKRDLQNPMGPGQPLSRYTLLESSDEHNEKRTTFIWTIHHAIYDGYSLPMLVQAIEDSYNSGNASSFTPFSIYVTPPSKQAIINGTAFWKKYLQESPGLSWTNFPPALPDDTGKNSLPSTARLQRKLDLASISVSKQAEPSSVSPQSTITTANMIRVAYALTLLLSCPRENNTSRPTTALFLESLSGRNASVPGVDRLTGPTLVNVPTRIHIPLDSDMPHVLATEQAWLVERMAHENFPLPLLLSLAPAPLELRNVLMIEDRSAFSINGSGRGILENGTEVLKLEETEELPMIFRCMIDKRVSIEVDIRYDQLVVPADTMEGFLELFVKNFKEIWLANEQQQHAVALY